MTRTDSETESPTDSTEYRVKAHGVEKAFGPLKVLKGVSFTVARGSATTIIGPSGSGKTTLLRALNALDVPDAGVVSVGGDDGVEIDFSKPVAKDTLRRYRAQSGFVFQSHNLFPHKTVLQNVTEGPLIVQKRPRDEVEAEAAELLGQVGLADKRDQYPFQLSGGQQQRVGIARALALKPKVVLFDEPTSALDPEMIAEVLDVMVGLADSGMTMICVTHEMGFARKAADRMVFMADGEIVEEGEPEMFFEKPRTERGRLFLSQILSH